jgi:hypothetical protein
MQGAATAIARIMDVYKLTATQIAAGTLVAADPQPYHPPMTGEQMGPPTETTRLQPTTVSILPVTCSTIAITITHYNGWSKLSASLNSTRLPVFVAQIFTPEIDACVTQIIDNNVFM